MALQVKQTNRRQFLGRSALGAGSLLFGPLLLESCTDHNIPPPTNPVHVPSAAFSVDAYDRAKTAIIADLGFVPGAGKILGSLTAIFWPSSGEDVWGQVRAQVEAAIGQQLNDLVYSQAKAKLDVLHVLIQDYLDAIKYGGDVKTKWVIVHDAFVSSQSFFTVAGSEVWLLPFFTQFANLYLSLLRDPLLPTKEDPNAYTGVSWGMTLTDIIGILADSQNFIPVAVKHTNQWYANGKGFMVRNTKRDDLNAEPFKTVNKYDREMTLAVLDFTDSWPYFDYAKHTYGAHNPDGTPINLFTREIYSDPYGNTNNGLVVLPAPATQFPTNLTVWGGHDNGGDYHILAVQLTYPSGGGPGGADTTPRMGVQDGGTNQHPYGGTFDLTNNPIEAVIVSYEKVGYVDYDVIDTLRFGFSNRTTSYQMGQQQGGGQFSSVVSYPNWAVSSIYIHGSSMITLNNYFADCIVFGFKRLPPV